MLESCLQCGLCLENCFLEKTGIPSFICFVRDEDTSHIWTCSNCWTCQDLCPAHINLLEIKWHLQQTFEPPSSYKASLINILNCGYSLPVDPEDMNPFRTEDGLEPVILASPEIIKTLLQN
ncbi:MAG TPA: hypothetical protein VHQ70_05660 [Syntrophomonadaceae bacterium]|nr:hypothetical protein [Syntrophomonadaceae bacterium]